MNDNEPFDGKIVAFTDGACVRNPGPGGWAAILRCYDQAANPTGREITQVGGAERTTNNRMEMTAAIEALKATPRGARVEIVSDSQILVNGATEWLEGWIARGWRTSSRKPVANVDLWQEIVALMECRTVTWRWVKGHNGDPDNDLVDGLAEAEARRFATLLEPLAG